MPLPTVVELASEFMARVLRPGDLAIDATVGNGHDTSFLAEQVGPTGMVIGIDIQDDALEATQSRLRSANLEDRVHLIKSDHAQLDRVIDIDSARRQPKGIMFNLGYLPGGNHAITTEAESTIRALDVATSVIDPAGLITVVVYTGHQSGVRESAQLLQWLEHRDSQSLKMLKIELLYPRSPAPWLLVLTPDLKRSSSS